MKIEINELFAGKLCAVVCIIFLFMMMVIGYGYEEGISIEAWNIEKLNYFVMMGMLFGAFLFFYTASFVFTVYAKIAKLERMIKEGVGDDNRR